MHTRIYSIHAISPITLIPPSSPNGPDQPVNSVDPTDSTDWVDRADSTDSGEWYAIQTKPRSEDKVTAFLAQKSIPTFLPRLLVRRRHGSRRWDALEPLFPGYLFARFTPDPRMLDRVRWAPGVRKVLGYGEEPVPVPVEVVSYLQERVGERGFIVPGPTFLPGTTVRFKRGPLAYLEGIIERPASRADRVRVLLKLLSTRVSVEVDIAELERV